MSAVPSSIRCPSCSGPLRPVVMRCEACELRVEARFAANEFASLGAEDLHLLRIFVHTEGSIREMESALGVSYPTVKARLAELKARLRLAEPVVVPPAPPPPTSGEAPKAVEHSPAVAPNDGGPGQVLSELESGKLSFDDALRQIRRTRGGRTKGGQS